MWYINVAPFVVPIPTKHKNAKYYVTEGFIVF